MLLAVVALYGNIHVYKKRKGIEDMRLGSYMEACCLWMLFLFALTELLSVGHALRFRFLFVIWAAFDVLLLCFLAAQLRRMEYTVKTAVKSVGAVCRDAWHILRKAPYYGILLLIGMVVLGLSLITTPYNWDSMTYHLPRIAYWAQNRSVAHYATHCIRQISSPVLAEFVNLHVYILCRGHDLLFNLLQGMSYLTCAVMAGAIAGRLGCGRFFRFLAMLLFMSMPIAYAEALTTQVDHFAAVWLLFFVYRLLDYADAQKAMRFDKVTVCRVGAMGLCVAWGYLAKPSVCVGMVIFALWLLLVCLKRKDRLQDLAAISFSALPCVAVPLVPEILRNFKSFGAYASPGAGAAQLVGTLQPSYLLVNMLKNLSFNMPTRFVKNGHEIFTVFAKKAAAVLGVELDAVSISEQGRPYMLHEAGTYACDTAVNPIVFWLFLFCVLWAVLGLGKKKWTGCCRGYFVAAAVSFAVFCTVLRWEPFVSRYMIAYLALICPMIAAGMQMATDGKRGRPFRWGIAGVVSLLCIVEAGNLTRYHFDNWRGSARIRPYGYFAARYDEMAVYFPLADQIKSCQYDTVGLHLLKADDFEYPFWEILDGCRLEHVLVSNESAVYADQSFVPDCIIWFGSLPEEPVRIGDRTYHKSTEFGNKQYLLEN